MLGFFGLLLGILSSVLRRCVDVVAENLLLRHQLTVLTGPGRNRPPVRGGDNRSCMPVRAVRRD